MRCAEQGQRTMDDHGAGFLHEVAGVVQFQRLWGTPDHLVQRSHDRQAEHWVVPGPEKGRDHPS